MQSLLKIPELEQGGLGAVTFELGTFRKDDAENKNAECSGMKIQLIVIRRVLSPLTCLTRSSNARGSVCESCTLMSYHITHA